MMVASFCFQIIFTTTSWTILLLKFEKGQSDGGTFHPVLPIKIRNCAWINSRPGSFYHMNVSVYLGRQKGGLGGGGGGGPWSKGYILTCSLLWTKSGTPSLCERSKLKCLGQKLQNRASSSFFCSLVCVQYNTRKRKSAKNGEGLGTPITWMTSGGREVDASVYYTECKPKNKKWRRPRNEASLRANS